MSLRAPRSASVLTGLASAVAIVAGAAGIFFSSSSTSADDPPPDRAAAAARLEKAFRALDAAVGDIPRETFEPRAVLAKVGASPKTLFEWVCDRTYWAPYRGALRGPEGVLMDRVGSSLDRALLLAELLRLAGHNVRLVRGEIGEERAVELVAKITPLPPQVAAEPPAVAVPADEGAKRAAELAKRFGLDPETVKQNAASASAEAARVAGEVAARVAEHAPALAGALAKAGIAPAEEAEEAEEKGWPEAVPDWVRAQAASLRDHWWVQRREGNVWIDLDPLTGDAEPGKAWTEPKETKEVKQAPIVLALDAKDCHEIHVKVVVERWEPRGGGTLREATVLEHTLRPAALHGRWIALDHHAVGKPGDPAGAGDEKDAWPKLKAALLETPEWLPVLSVGDELLVESSFTVAGAVKRKPELFPASSVGKGVTGGFGGLGGGLGGGEPEEEQPAVGREDAAPDGSVLTAEWLDLEIRAPGEAPRMHRREIFDLVGPAARAAGGAKLAKPAADEKERLRRALVLIGSIELLPVVCDLPAEYVADLFTRRVLKERATWLELARWDPDAPPKDAAAKVRSVGRSPGRLYAMAGLRRDRGRPTGTVFIDRPNVFIDRGIPIEDGESGVRIREVFDVVANDVAVRPGTPSAAAFAARLEQGVLDTAAEGVLLPGSAVPENTTDIFAAAAARGIEPVTIRAAADPALAALTEAGLPPDARARIERDLAAGFAVVAPKQPIPVDAEGGAPPRLGWWRVDPATGATVGVMDTGFHAASVERRLVEAIQRWVQLPYRLTLAQIRAEGPRGLIELSGALPGSPRAAVLTALWWQLASALGW